MNKKIQQITTVIIIGFFFILDRLLKNFFVLNQSFNKIIYKNFLSLSFYKNTGIAFGIQIPIYLIITISILILSFLLFWFFRKKQNHNIINNLAFYLIFLGALSNLIDRIFLNFTIDYLHIYISVINIADIMITIGILILFLKETKIVKKTKI